MASQTKMLVARCTTAHSGTYALAGDNPRGATTADCGGLSLGAVLCRRGSGRLVSVLSGYTPIPGSILCGHDDGITWLDATRRLIMDSDSAIANVLEVLVPLIALGVLATPAVLSALKGRWWAGVLGVAGFVGGFVVAFGAFGTPEPSTEFQETAAFQVINAGINVALFGGLILLILSAVRSARPGSWWDRHHRPRPPTQALLD